MPGRLFFTVLSCTSIQILIFVPLSLQYRDGRSAFVVYPLALLQSLTVVLCPLQYEEGMLGGISAYTRGVGRLDLGADTLSYLKKILTSRVYDVAIESPLERANKISDRVGSDIFLKREDLQKVRLPLSLAFPFPVVPLLHCILLFVQLQDA